MIDRMIDRIKSESLKFVDGKCYFKGALFTGAAIDINKENGLIESAACYKEGIPTSPYINEHLPVQHDIRVDFDYLGVHEESYDDGEPYYYNGKQFKGIAFEFQDDFCISE